MGSAYDCYTRVPYGSLIATIMLITGVAVFASQMFAGVSFTLQLFNDVFQMKIYWMDTIRTVFITAAACMALYAILLLVVGIAATGATRDQVFRGGRAKIGGRVSIALCMFLTYVLNLAWIAIMAFLIVVTFVYMLYARICNHAPLESVEMGRCIPFKHVAFLFPNTSYPNYDINRFSKCGNDFRRLCESIKDAEGIYLAACLASLVVVLSLTHFLICLSANYTHIKEGVKNKELDYLQSLQNGELSALTKANGYDYASTDI
ncbi:hypothetical protein BV898_11009 [Hypsibius exemplaris]|uniref:Neuronal membrane glycoprotein M6-b n=1 Tax=Hypsibius exemplaris TaxID=2072580 RepID=A0A1W0WHR4_HYPEX|nr:hypothetical protein BV898_11009 [Hypsibius exemplaris]